MNIMGSKSSKCSSRSNITNVYATCRKCMQDLTFIADPSKFKNPSCPCMSTNVERTLNENQWVCKYCNNLFMFQNEDEINCKCGAKDWEYFIY